MNTNKILACMCAFLAVVTILSPFAFLRAEENPAQGPSYAPLTDLPGISSTDIKSEGGFGKYLRNVFNLTILVAGVLAVLMITIGGVRYMTSEAFGTKNSAKNQIWMAILGFLLAVSSVFILQIINPKLLELGFIANIPEGSFSVPPQGLQGDPSRPATGCTASADQDARQCYPVTVSTSADTGIRLCANSGSFRDEDEGNDYINLNESDCVTEPEYTQVCCGFVPPRNGCSGRGVNDGYTECKWSLESNVGENDCVDSSGAPVFAGLFDTDTGDTGGGKWVCSGNRPGTYSDCCAKK